MSLTKGLGWFRSEAQGCLEDDKISVAPAVSGYTPAASATPAIGAEPGSVDLDSLYDPAETAAL